MFKLYAKIVLLAFLASQTRSVTAQDNVQTSADIVVRFESITPLPPGVYTQEVIVQPDTCSIRIDFIDFSLGQPVQLNNTTAFFCVSDFDMLELIPNGLPEIKLPVLCGELSGQHIYLRTQDYDQTTLLDATILRTLNLKVTLTGLKNLLPASTKWNITSTQIPCQLADNVNSELSLPPAGCLQYNTEVNGTIKSFNLLGGSYFGNLNYTICFARPPGAYELILSGIVFGLSTNGNTSMGRDCNTAVKLNAVVSQDYLQIPDARINGIDGDAAVNSLLFCGSSLLNVNVTIQFDSKALFSIIVVTDGSAIPSIEEIGFELYYEIPTN